MLTWHKELWLIDHGASFYFHHSWHSFTEQASRPFTQVKDHVLLKQADELDSVNERFRKIVTVELIQSIVSLIPVAWLADDSKESVIEKRKIYFQFLVARLAASEIFVKEAKHAREALI